MFKIHSHIILFFLASFFIGCGDKEEKIEKYNGEWKSEVYPIFDEQHDTIVGFEKVSYLFTNNTIEEKIFQGINEDSIYESLMCFKRAGASAIVSYFALDIAKNLKSN